MTKTEKRGALLFFGKAGCARCHNGSLLTNQQHYNLAVPQLGPGDGIDAPLDIGRARETGEIDDMFAFRTPPLRNVAETGPWMHNGAYTTLEGTVKHHLNAVQALQDYDSSQLDSDLQSTVQDDADSLALILSTVKPQFVRRIKLSDKELSELLSFLDALTSPSLDDLDDFIPDEVPSGIPIDGVE